ncbi:SLAM family member 9 [Labeo rohita]|uniref:SLAM family member 9 n=1 Tax=Labeo rohita TaxID=84645 RepID=A0ABQ8L943_LABRO|nr:SLAM family member 9 [Labeo rohita]
MEGDSVTLNSDLTEIMDDDRIQWMFFNTLIAEINKWVNRFTVHDDVLDGRFRDRLKLNKQTGSLTITNTTTEHVGVYGVRINHMSMFFFLTVYDEISVMEGDSITLNSDLTEIVNDDRIVWMFGIETTLIAGIFKPVNNMTVYDDVLDGRFRDRLKLDIQTGSLTITNIRIEEAGYYKVWKTGSKPSLKPLHVFVYAVNVSDVTLSWYKGNSLLSSISVSDLSISLSLPLEIERVNDSYSCVVAYSFTNQTTHLNTELCHTCSDSVHCCGSTEAVIRLVLSALVGVATVILLVYDIRSRRAEQDQAHVHTSEKGAQVH